MKKKIRNKNKIEKPSIYRRWKNENEIYHSKSTKHFYVGIAKKSYLVAGHDTTTHPSRKTNGEPRNRYIKLSRNPNPADQRDSFIHKNLRIVSSRFEDSGRERLTPKKGWKLHRRDRKMIRKIDKKKTAQLAFDNCLKLSADKKIKK